jgi:hypothetical protein
MKFQHNPPDDFSENRSKWTLKLNFPHVNVQFSNTALNDE